MIKGGKAAKNKTEIAPWKGATPYLTGANLKGITGVLELGNDLYKGSVNDPKLEALAAKQAAEAEARLSDPHRQYISEGAHRVVQGALSPNISKVPTINATRGIVTTNATANASPAALAQMTAARAQSAPKVSFNSVNAGNVDGNAARAAFGEIDPTQALSQLLAGNVNPHIDAIANTVTTNLTNNLRENVLPGAQSGAIASGQFGGSRQGIAEGLAMSRLNQDLATGITPLYGSAFENAQARKSQAANALNNQAVGIATDNTNRQLSADQFNSTGRFNADSGNAQRQQAINQLNAQLAQQASQYNTGSANDINRFNSSLVTDMSKFNTGNEIDLAKFNAGNELDINKFNANLGLQNNTQNMAAAAQDVNTRLQGINVLDRMRTHRDQDYGTAFNALTRANDREWDLLNRYAGGVVLPASGLGQTNVQSGSSGNNPITGALGGAAAGSAFGPWGAAIGGGLGLLGGIL